MISIVVCSINESYLEKLVKNIAETIGCQFELLIEKNEANKGICSVYNTKALLAKFDFLIFMHEDVKFDSKNWGHIVVNNFQDENVGIVGLSGSIYKSYHPGVWSASQKSLYRISGKYYNDQKISNESINYRVAVVDGCFIAVRKNIFNQYKFDENLKNFHGYDIDFSLNIAQRYLNIVIANIDFVHFSSGNQNLEWLKSSYYVHKKWEKILPFKVGAISKKQQKLADYLSLQNVYNICYNEGYSTKILLKYYFLFISLYFKYNSFRYTRKTIKYIINKKFYNHN